MDINALKGKLQETLDKTDLDEKIKAGADKLREKAADVDVDKLKAQAKDLRGKVQEALDKTDLDEKVKAKAEVLKDKIKENID